jgi:hypothetical protein
VFHAILRRGVCRRENSSGADFDGDELHDGVQFPGGDMLDRLHRARRCADRRRHHDQQRQLERVVSAELFDRTDHVPDDLRANLAIAIIS